MLTKASLDHLLFSHQWRITFCQSFSLIRFVASSSFPTSQVEAACWRRSLCLVWFGVIAAGCNRSCVAVVVVAGVAGPAEGSFHLRMRVVDHLRRTLAAWECHTRSWTPSEPEWEIVQAVGVAPPRYPVRLVRPAVHSSLVAGTAMPIEHSKQS